MAGQQPQQRGNRSLDSYVGVHTRVEKFRNDHPTARLVTTIIKDDPLTVRCEVYLDGNESGIPNSTGQADSEGGMGGRGNSTLEKVETAAVGRCLAFLGYEIREGIASREEMQQSQQRQPSAKPQPVPDKPAAVPDDPDELDAQISGLLSELGKESVNFSKYVQKTYNVEGPWYDQDVPLKQKLLVYLRGLASKNPKAS